MSQIFELSAALTLDPEGFIQSLRSAEASARQFQSSLENRLGAVSSAMNRLQSSMTASWGSITASIRQAIGSLQTFLSLSGQAGAPAAQGFATGLDYVPYNNYPARLHEGEAVLTKLEADQWRSGTPSAGLDVSALAQTMADALSGVTVQMDGHTVGTLVAPAVNQYIARHAAAGRYR